LVQSLLNIADNIHIRSRRLVGEAPKLAHAVGDKAEAAYRRGDLFEKRRRLMAEWAAYCNAPAGNAREKVITLRGTR